MKYLVALLICCFSNMLYGQEIEKLLNEAHTLEVTFKEKAALEKKIESFNKEKAAQIKKDLIAHQVANQRIQQYCEHHSLNIHMPFERDSLNNF
jgi:hypothetical protein